ncbi:hypothetical protein D3C76_580490 [compost metagenome]
MLQALRRALLGLQVFSVVGRKCQQVTTAQVGQQCTEADNEQHESRNRRHGDGTDFFVTGHAQLLFGNDQVIELLADFIGDALAPAIADRGLVIALAAAQADHLAAEVVPGLLQGHQPVNTVNLLRVILDHAAQALQAAENAWLGHLVRVKEALVARDQEAAHARFHVDRQLDRFVGIADHPVGVLDPLHGRKQVVDHRDEGHGPQQANPQGEADVAAQQLAKASLVHRGCLNHEKTPELEKSIEKSGRSVVIVICHCAVLISESNQLSRVWQGI